MHIIYFLRKWVLNMATKSFHEQEKINNIMKLRTYFAELPPYVTDYSRGRETTQTTKTQLSYVYDFRIFFWFLTIANPDFKDKIIREIPLTFLNKLGPTDIEEYLQFLKCYEHPVTGKTVTNDLPSISRKLSSLRSFFSYLHRHAMISQNPASLVDTPRLHDKEIIQLDPDEVAILLDYMEECGTNLSPHKKAYYKKTIIRDLAIVTLLLGTGIRVSECVGLDINDIDLKNDGIRIIRKGGNEMMVYFGPEVETALLNYLEIREEIVPLSDHENALFFSMQRRRISTDAIENVVKKYSEASIPHKNITPHKLRSTYGTALYQETGDIYLVADVLGHSDVNTTKKHYAKTGDARRRQAASAVSLREK